MQTIKRSIPDITQVSSSNNYSKYKLQTTFKGILEDDNIYAIDQDSCRDSKNVYVDWNDRLVSRPTLQYGDIPTEILNVVGLITYKLIDIKDYGSTSIYVWQNMLVGDTNYNKYAIICYNPNKTVDTTHGYINLLTGITNYHICSVEQYIICFNDKGAKIINVDEYEYGWQNFTDDKFQDIPVVKEITETQTFEAKGNEFIPGRYKENYTWTQNSKPSIPTNIDYTQVISPSFGEIYENEAANMYMAPEYTILQPIADNKLPSNNEIYDYTISAAKGMLCIAYPTFAYISDTKGEVFYKLQYPILTSNFILGTLSEDAEAYFVVTRENVYRYNFDTKQWSAFIIEDTLVRRYNFMPYCFLTAETFAFIANDSDDETRLYFHGKGLYSGNDYTDDHMNTQDLDDYYIVSSITECSSVENYLHDITGTKTFTEIFANYRDNSLNYNYNNNFKYQMKIDNITDNNIGARAVINIIVNGQTSSTTLDGYVTPSYMITIIGGNTYNFTKNQKIMSIYSNKGTEYNITLDKYQHFNTMLFTYNPNVDIGEIAFEINVTGYDTSEHSYYTGTLLISIQRVTATGYTYLYEFSFINEGKLNLSPVDINSAQGVLMLPSAYIYSCDIKSLSNTTTTITLPFKVGADLSTLENSSRSRFYKDNYIVIDPTIDCFYLVGYYNEKLILWTNVFYEKSIATVTVLKGSSGTPFTKVPQISYSDTELYLGFDNLLQITENAQNTDGNMLFNLPAKNNQVFIDNITALKNISTTEVAIFFKDKIKICSRQTDENLGTVYLYYNTKLSTGVRLGDTVINTLEGDYTIFPTLRGLAIMSYQAFMATTDQTLEYVTDNQKDLWDAFYEASSEIRIIQWRTRLVFTNGSKNILLYDLKNGSWWRWEIPNNVLIALTDQIGLKVISVDDIVNHLELLEFKAVTPYYDFSENKEYLPIDWFYESQPLHFDAPNHYKNIKQLVFQFSHSETLEEQHKSMIAQIKLYRKKVTIREPEEVAFNVEQLRTFVKRFNYWKINELQWAIGANLDCANQTALELNGMSVKYEIGEEVR